MALATGMVGDCVFFTELDWMSPGIMGIIRNGKVDKWHDDYEDSIIIAWMNGNEKGLTTGPRDDEWTTTPFHPTTRSNDQSDTLFR
ncbi:hypothetical protein VTJ04DRAFT_3838 [Mycothermus thermophilus]|uniref:uncharacterized protein n=1 Tax=Humicola insolens TaxID=85995 RepID=UPI003741F8AD